MSRKVQENFTEKRLAARNYKIMRQFKCKSQSEIEADTGISKQNLSTWENEMGNPGPGFMDQLSKYFGLPKELFLMDGLTLDYLKTKFSSENNTQDEKRSNNKEKPLGDEDPLFIYKKLVEGVSEYTLVPKQMIGKTEEAMKETIKAKDNLIDHLKREIAIYRSRTAAKKTK